MSDAITIRPLAEDDAAAFKALRLKATLDAPTALWPTYDEEAVRTLEDTRNRIRATDHQIVFGAFAGDELAGIARQRLEIGHLRRRRVGARHACVTPCCRRLAGDGPTHCPDASGGASFPTN